MFYKDPHTGEHKVLSAEEEKNFKSLMRSIGKEDVELVDLLLEDTPIIAHAFDQNGNYGLNFASIHHTSAGLEIIKLLMAYGANPYYENNRGFTAIHDLDDITDISLKAEFCRAMGIDLNTTAILRSIRHAKSVAEVEAKYAAYDRATSFEEKFAIDSKRALRDYRDDPRAKAIAYDRATSFEEKIAIDPLRAMQEHANDPRVREMHQNLGNMHHYTVLEGELSEQAQEAINSIYKKHDQKKLDQFEFSLQDSSISELIASIFGNKQADVALETKESLFASLTDWLGVDLAQLSYLLGFSYSSGFLPFYAGHGKPDGDFEPYPGGGSGAIFEDSPALLPENVRIVAVLGNGTFVITEDQDQPTSM